MSLSATGEIILSVSFWAYNRAMPIIRFTAEQIRKPEDSKDVLVHTEDASDCYGEVCGQYHEEDGEALKPGAHDHVVITGREPATTPRFISVPKE
jgi:hypothetical protein